MIEIIRSWCEGIVVAIIISLIIELLIPEGNNKKYAKVVIGIYIVFVVINPLLQLLDYDFDIYEMFNIQTEEVVSSSDDIKEIYVVGIEESIKSEIENFGYIVEDVKIELDDNYENIKKITLKINGKKVENTIVEPVIIGNNNTENENNDEIVNLLKSNYFVEENQINFIQ